MSRVLSIEQYANELGISQTCLHIQFWNDTRSGKRSYKRNRPSESVTCFLEGYKPAKDVVIKPFRFSINQVEFSKLTVNAKDSSGTLPPQFQHYTSSDVKLEDTGKVSNPLKKDKPE